MQQANDSGRMRSYAFDDPQWGYAHTVSPGEGLMSVARGFKPLMEGEHTTVEAAIIIGRHNGLLGEDGNGKWQDVRLQIGQQLHIPIPRESEVFAMTVNTTPDVTSLVTLFNDNSLLAPHIAADPARAEAALRALNPDLEATLASGTAEEIIVNIPAPNDFAHVTPLRAPTITDAGARATLIVAEGTDPEKPDHAETCFDYANDYANALTPDAETRAAIYAVDEIYHGSMIHSMHDLPAANPNEYLVFSQSYAYDQTLNGYVPSDTYINLQNVHFMPAGNIAGELGKHDLISAEEQHLGPRSYTIGAIHEQLGKPVMGYYSSAGADLLAPPVPLYNGEYAAGTSLATPMMAALDRQMLENYGGVLNQEEIMAAAFMSTEMDIHSPNNKLMAFTTNGGGRPHNTYAGAGMIDPARWQENLETMVGIKRHMQYQPDMISETIPLHDQQPVVQTNMLGDTTYTYTIPMPADMTLDRLSFVLDTENNVPLEDTTITAPSGFIYQMGKNSLNAHATSAFALEDVRIGDTMTITTTAPLDGDSRAIIRGHGDGNIVQALRDNLMERGLLPQPNASYIGTTPRAEFEAAYFGTQPSAGTGLQNINSQNNKDNPVTPETPKDEPTERPVLPPIPGLPDFKL
ncbi:MAG: hypothetical protein KJ667_00530 [Alphaproteobacteria bacterium]|nr:hypothetical protein [Alphaproteobacteria bacterium]